MFMVVGVGGNSGAMSERLMIPEQLRATRAHLESQRPAQSLTHVGARDVALAMHMDRHTRMPMCICRCSFYVFWDPGEPSK